MPKRAVLVDISSDSKKFVAGTKRAEQAAKSLNDRIEETGKAIALAYVAWKVVDFGASAVKAATDDAAAQVVLRKAIEGATGSRDVDMRSIEDWISSVQNASGVLDDELRPALATLVGATKNVGEAQKLMAIAMDTARAKGVPLETVATALAKAYAGNTTALVKLVPGIKQAGEKTLQFADAKERLNEMFTGTAAAWADTDAGKMARLNAQWSDMQETIGTALVPALSKVAAVVSDVFGWFNSLDSGTQDLIVTIGLVAAGIYVAVSAFTAMRAAVTALGLSTPMLAGFTAAAGAVIAVVSLFGDEEDEVDQLARDLNDTLHAGAGAFDANKVAALGAAEAVREYGGAATAEMDASLRKTFLESDNLRKGLLALGLQVDDVTRANHGDADAQARVIAARRKAVASGQIQVKATGGLIVSQEDLTAATEQWILTGTRARIVGDGALAMWSDSESQIFATTNEMTKQNQAWAENVDLAKEQALLGDRQAAAWLKATGHLDDLTAAQRASVEATLGSNKAVTSAAAAWRKLTGWAGSASKALATAWDATAVVADSAIQISETGDAYATAAGKADLFREAINKIVAPAIELEETGRQLRDNAASLTQALIDNGDTLDINTEKGRANREELQKSAQGILDHAAAMVRSGASTEEATAFVLWQTQALAGQWGATKDANAAAADYLTTLGLTPAQVETAIRLAGDQQAKAQIEDVKSKLGEIPRSVASSIQADIDNGSYATALAKLNALARTRTVLFNVRTVDSATRGGDGGRDYRAAGGPVRAGEAYVVGEHQRELFVPNVAGRILPRVPSHLDGDTGGQFTFNNYGPINGVKDLEATLAGWWRRQQAQRRFAS